RAPASSRCGRRSGSAPGLPKRGQRQVPLARARVDRSPRPLPPHGPSGLPCSRGLRPLQGLKARGVECLIPLLCSLVYRCGP
uniref:Uncharacterized protein n=1 Tax=Triticum urartu TaxID=4572 RepID=A0A8R7V4U2_TRIUA